MGSNLLIPVGPSTRRVTLDPTSLPRWVPGGSDLDLDLNTSLFETFGYLSVTVSVVSSLLTLLYGSEEEKREDGRRSVTDDNQIGLSFGRPSLGPFTSNTPVV